ncbi:MAG: prepilin peptidase [Kiritimatiellia bacterium]
MQLVHLVLPLMFAVACYTEIRWRQIPNWLTIAGMGFGLGSAFIEGDGSGLLSASIGLAVGGGIFLPFCLMGVLGGGDMKLMAAVGAMVGWPLILVALCHTCLAGGILAIVFMVWYGRVWSTLANACRILFGGTARQRSGLRNVPMIPYGIAITAGTLFALFYKF